MDSIQDRRSIRKYKSLPVDKEDIDQVIEAAILAPSAKNRQPWKYLVYTEAGKAAILDEMEKGLLREKNGQAILPESRGGLLDAFYTLKVMRQAPVLIIILNENGKTPFEEIDTDHRITEICDTLSIGASIENMLLKATELGYGTLWIANTCFAYSELETYINMPGQIVGAVSLGYPDESPNKRPRKSLDEVVVYM